MALPFPKLSSEYRKDIESLSTLELLPCCQTDGVLRELCHFLLHANYKYYISTEQMWKDKREKIKSAVQRNVSHVNEEHEPLCWISWGSIAVSVQLCLSLF